MGPKSKDSKTPKKLAKTCKISHNEAKADCPNGLKDELPNSIEDADNIGDRRPGMLLKDVNNTNLSTKRPDFELSSRVENKEKRPKKKRKHAESIDKEELGKLEDALKEQDHLSEEYYRTLLAIKKMKGEEISPFRLIKYSYPILNRVFSDEDNSKLNVDAGAIGFYHNKKIDVSGLFKAESFIGLNLHSFISCMDSNSEITALGLKTSLGPFDIFEVRQGLSRIVLLDRGLNVIKQMNFDFGDVVNLKIIGNFLIVLFGNGGLIKFGNFDENKPVFRYEGPEKIVAFDAKDSEIVFTNGTTIFDSSNKKIDFEELIVDLAVGTEKIYLLSIIGKIYMLDFNFSKIAELHSKQRFNKIQFLDGMLVATEDSESIQAVFFHRDSPDVFTAHFLAGYDGIFACFKNYRTSKRSKKIFQVLKTDDILYFLDNESDFDPGLRSFIPNIRTFIDHFLFVTEYGLIVKVFYT